MAITTKQLLNYSWMSQAAYLDFSGLSNSTSATIVQGRLTASPINAANNFATEQAKNFLGLDTVDPTDGYSFISQLPNTTNGTSMAVFKNNDVTNGSYTLAIRGTEPTAQLFTDLLQDIFGVVLAGKAKVQLIEAFRYYKQITTAGGQVVYTNFVARSDARQHKAANASFY